MRVCRTNARVTRLTFGLGVLIALLTLAGIATLVLAVGSLALGRFHLFAVARGRQGFVSASRLTVAAVIVADETVVIAAVTRLTKGEVSIEWRRTQGEASGCLPGSTSRLLHVHRLTRASIGTLPFVEVVGWNDVEWNVAIVLIHHATTRTERSLTLSWHGTVGE